MRKISPVGISHQPSAISHQPSAISPPGKLPRQQVEPFPARLTPFAHPTTGQPIQIDPAAAVPHGCALSCAERATLHPSIEPRPARQSCGLPHLRPLSARQCSLCEYQLVPRSARHCDYKDKSPPSSRAQVPAPSAPVRIPHLRLRLRRRRRRRRRRRHRHRPSNHRLPPVPAPTTTPGATWPPGRM